MSRCAPARAPPVAGGSGAARASQASGNGTGSRAEGAPALRSHIARGVLRQRTRRICMFACLAEARRPSRSCPSATAQWRDSRAVARMLAARYALLYPGEVEQVVLVNPIGLEDWKSLGVPWRSVDAWYASEMQATAESIRQYEQATYYVEFPELGHAQIQDPAQFHQALLKGIR